MTTPCTNCGALIEYEPIPEAPAIVPRRCANCGDVNPVAAKAAAEAEAKAKVLLWEQLCPAAYRTVEEGGITDPTRLPTQWLHPFHPTNEPPGMLLIGPSGRFKTRAMWRLIRRLFDEGKSILAYTARGFEAAYRDADGKHELKAFLDRCGSVGVFFLDDLGKAKWSQNTVETFYEIVEVRGSNLLPIYVTTNLKGADLAGHMDLDTAMSDPLLRRLREFCRCVSM